MLSPGETAQRDSAKASLFCAVTLIRRASVDTVQTNAKRHSFSQFTKESLRIPHACGMG